MGYKRNYQVDNIKIILIFCVILGHLLESIGGGYNIYKVIYSFHMPMFIFINGYCAPRACASKKMLFKLIYPYILFQILYGLFNTYIINEEGAAFFSVQFSTPYWLLWYLLTLIYYYLLIPIIATESRKCAIGIIIGTIILAIGIGFDNSIGYYMSLSRTFVFFPFFVCGYYLGHDVFKRNLTEKSFHMNIFVKAVFLFLAIIISGIVYRQNLNAGALFGSVSYIQGEFPWFIRLEMIVMAFIWVGVFIAIIPNREIFGKVDTFPAYILHGFIVLYLKKNNPFIYTLPINLVIAAMTSMTIILMFGNKYVSRMARLAFRGDWIEKMCKEDNCEKRYYSKFKKL